MKATSAILLFVFASSLSAQEFSPADHPVKSVAKKYEANAVEIRALSETIRDQSKLEGDRLESFRKLRREYPEAVLPVAAEVVDDDSLKVALFATELLGAGAAMSDHSMPENGAHSPAMKYMMAKHNLALAGLRRGLTDSRKEVYTPAATTLASLGDNDGLKAIVEAAEQGVYEESAAVGYLGLAPSEKAGIYIDRYLQSEKTEVQVAAIGQLSYIPDYEGKLRSEYLMNPNAKPELRAVVVRGLARKADNLLLLLLDPETDPEIIQEGVSTYLKSNLAKIDASEAQALEAAVKAYSRSHPNFDAEKVLAPIREK